VGREALRTGGKVMTDIATNPGQTGDILSKHVTETMQNIIKKLRGGGARKRKRACSRKPSQRKHNAKRAKITKRKSSAKKQGPPPAFQDYKRDIFS